jgi:DNA-binding response OmpR family regulator
MTGNHDGRPRILAADDDPDIRELVAFRLERAGYEVIVAADGEEALRLIRAERPNLVILDHRMPGMTGIEVVRELRADAATAKIPAILLTASVQEESVTRGFDAGADDYIKKPFSPQELTARVQAILGRR